ncbi:hypothetical protein ACFVAV_13835 [Nocardia sp. NPDC057663]|uniref:hypothetical protein n=1 Tax=Nocardia sp. NPDC057663 TaxID=3346201 RepID=UPI00366AC55E
MTALSCSAIDVGNQFYEPLDAVTFDGRSPQAVPDDTDIAAFCGPGSGALR